jgi:integrase
VKQYSKTDVRYWRQKLEKRGSGQDWHARIAFQGLRERFPLKTANADEAAAKARDIYISLHKEGWGTTKEKFKTWRASTRDPSLAVTVGEFIEAVRAVSAVRSTTFLTYERKFRLLVAQIVSLKSDKSKHDRRRGYLKFRKKVNAVHLVDITEGAIKRWHVDYIKRSSSTPLERERAKRSARSIVRNSKALFSPGILKGISLPMPSPLPFAFKLKELGKLEPTRYRSTINLPLLVKLANDELRDNNPELFKVFVLAVGAGLRRSEIDSLTWKQFDWSNERLNIEVTDVGGLKSAKSAEAIDIGPEMVAVFKKFMKGHEGPFVVSSAVAPMPAAHWKHYRCERHFVELIDWLKSKGVEDPHPLHALRKEFGSAINQKFGIFAASSALRHSSITLTREHYIDKKERIALDLPELAKGGAA